MNIKSGLGEANGHDEYKARVTQLPTSWKNAHFPKDPSRNPEPHQEIIADEFTLNFSSGAITTYDGLKEWLAGPGSQVAASMHVISDFSAEENEDGTYSIQMDFDWEGILPNGAELVAKTRDSWTATNEVT